MLGACPSDPPMPAGYRITQSVSPAIQRWAYSIVHDPHTTYGDRFEALFNNRPYVARIEHHTWTTDSQGNHVPGCYKGVTVYEPTDITHVIYNEANGKTVSSDSRRTFIELLLVGTALFSASFAVASALLRSNQSRKLVEEAHRTALRHGRKADLSAPEKAWLRNLSG